MSRLRSRVGLILLAIPVLVAFGAGGYLAAKAWAPVDHTRSAPAVRSTEHAHGSGMDGMDGMDMTHDHAGMTGGAMPGMTGGATHAGHDASPAVPSARPRVLVLGTFAALNVAVLLTAAVLRRRGGVRRSRRDDSRRSATVPTI